MKLQNFEFKNYLNHYLKRSDHFLGTLKFLRTPRTPPSKSATECCSLIYHSQYTLNIHCL